MTPKEFDIVCSILEQSSQYAYVKGHEDGLGKNDAKPERFKMTREHKLTLKTNIEKLVNKR